jgi:hypothetical protein
MSATVCPICGKNFGFESEDTALVTKLTVVPIPKFVSHCTGGNGLPVLGRLTRFWEGEGASRIEVEPKFSDFLG